MQREAFYKYNKKPLNLAISLWTWLPNIGTPWYSHVEKGFFIDGEWKYFSSTMRDGAKGCRWVNEDDLFKHRERWDVYEVENPPRSDEDMIVDANKLVGCGYDKPGIFGFILPIKKFNDKDKWYCSEAVYKITTGLWRWLISPRKYFKLSKKRYGLRLIDVDKKNN